VSPNRLMDFSPPSNDNLVLAEADAELSKPHTSCCHTCTGWPQKLRRPTEWWLA